MRRPSAQRRREWDSNSRWACTHAGFQDRCLKPLGHPSSYENQVVTDLTLLPILPFATGLPPEPGRMCSCRPRLGKRRFHDLGRAIVGVFEEMSVNAERDRGRAVAKPP